MGTSTSQYIPPNAPIYSGNPTNAPIRHSINEIEETDVSQYRSRPSQAGLHIEIALDQKPFKSGHLLKRGFKNYAAWKKRYCILLKDGYFNYYNSKRKIKGSVNFSHAHQCIVCPKEPKKFFVLAKRKWEFKADNKAEASEWIKLIQKVMTLSTPIHTSKGLSQHRLYQRQEFDSDEDQSVIEEKQSQNSIHSYKKHSKYTKRRTRTRTSSISSMSSVESATQNKISFNSWKISVIDSLKDIIITQENREKSGNFTKDSYYEIANILKDENNLQKIFYQITANKKYMSMKQYIIIEKLLQKSKNNYAEIQSLATKLLNDSKNSTNELKDNDTHPRPRYSRNPTNDEQSVVSRLSRWDEQSVISTLSRWDDGQSVISELSMFSRARSNTHKTNASGRASHTKQTLPPNYDPNKVRLSYLFDYDECFDECYDESLMDNDPNNEYGQELPKLDLQYYESMKYDDTTHMQNQGEIDEDINIRVEIPVNPASEILGNFLSASCGLCVPGLDVITSVESAKTYKLLDEFCDNINIDTGDPPTLLVYEELDGVSLCDLKSQLEVVNISLDKLDKGGTGNDTTTQQRIQKYFVSVVRKTFGSHLPYSFNRGGRSMLRDAGFVFAVDMFLFNISRFPVLVPFEGKSNSHHLFISTDEDGDSALYGLQNRFMGGHDIIDMPYFLLNGGELNDTHSIKLLRQKQSARVHKYLNALQTFLTVLSDYYQNVISPYITKNGGKNDTKNMTKLLHGLPKEKSANKYAKLDYKSLVDLCLRPIANYLYIHCGFELIIIDEFASNPSECSKNIGINAEVYKKLVSDNADEFALQILEIYRNKLIDNMITLLVEGVLIGISEIADQLAISDIDVILSDIRTLDQNMCGIDIIDSNFLKLALRLFHSTASTFQLNIEDSSDEEGDNYNTDDEQREITPTPTPTGRTEKDISF